MSIFEDGQGTAENGGQTAENKTTTETGGADKGGDNLSPSEKFKATTGADGKVTLEDESGNKVTGVPQDKAMGTQSEKKVEYPENVLSRIPEKYRNAADPLKAWEDGTKELTSKLREGKQDVPETFAINLPEVAKKANVSINEKDPLYLSFSKYAKEAGYSQSQFDAAISAYLENEIGNMEASSKEKEKLGKEGPAMLQSTALRLERHLGQKEARSILDQITTADGAIQLSRLVGMIGKSVTLPSSTTGAGVTEGVDEVSDYRSRLKDARMKTDKEFRKETLQMGERLKPAIDEDLKKRGVIGGRGNSA